MMSPSEPFVPVRPSELHRRRMRLMLWIGSALLIVVGLGWGAYFTALGRWAIVAMDLVILSIGIVIALLPSFCWL